MWGQPAQNSENEKRNKKKRKKDTRKWEKIGGNTRRKRTVRADNDSLS